MSFKASVVTLFPEMFPGPLGVSLAGTALERGDWTLETVDLRQFGDGKHNRVDDTPAGGGAGMVLRADVVADAVDSIGEDDRPRLLMSPRGQPLTQNRVRDLARGPGAIIVCGRFEGVDQRVIDGRNLEEISVGDYVLSGGEPAAMIVLDAVVRLLPGVMGNDASGTEESFENGLLEHPQYTRPQAWEGREIPEILTSGNHRKIADWRHSQSVRLTSERRPDLVGGVGADRIFSSIIPALPVKDLDEGIAFYRDLLGFECVYLDEGGYAVLSREGIELHLWLAGDESWKTRQSETPVISGAESFLAGTHSCRIVVNGVIALYDQLKNSGAVHPGAVLEKKPWGSTEFGVQDPYGNLVIFHEWL